MGSRRTGRGRWAIRRDPRSGGALSVGYVGAVVVLLLVVSSALLLSPIGRQTESSALPQAGRAYSTAPPASVVEAAMKVAAAARKTDFPRRTASPFVPSELRGPKEGPFLSLLAAGPVDIRSGPAGTLVRRFPATLYGSTPTAFLAVDQATDGKGRLWYRALLPIRPNGTRGWILATQVKTRVLRRAVLVAQGANLLTVYEGEKVAASYPVCVGARSTPTPSGDFFIDQRIRTSPGGAYGPLALGLSAFSDVLTDWPGGGVVGIHGTNRPSSIGRDVSHGCVRLRNADILALGSLVEFGTPVFIRP